jgi:hypothetical protein
MRNKVIVCPNKDKPGVHKEAARAYAKWLENYKKKQEGRGRNGR